jgi:phenylacetic acid degradation operon negative regulatory protein
MVPFLFGVTGRAELPGPVLHQLLTDTGMTGPAARALITRMRADGQVASTRHGRTASYRMVGPFAESFRRIRDAPGRVPVPWTGSFHALLYQVPEQDRPYRDLLRRNALLSGYGLLQPGVLIALTDRTHAFAGILDRRPDGTRIYRTSIAMSTPDAATAAYEAWDLGAVDRLYQGYIATLTEALETVPESPPADAESLRTLARLVQMPLSDSLRDPELPPELLPAGWPGARLRQLTAEVARRLGPPAQRYAAGLLA